MAYKCPITSNSSTNISAALQSAVSENAMFSEVPETDVKY